ncbi:hypothetical protein FRC14_002268 [Serendipita sp. 396]|nr:hypothetical protein FRC14_002268 [Serendipita sp. 396]KAG8784896.1 hypothetical protein FRC15_002385 [Serendipita sp. 397]KAG8800688.1 hypothetical protein FRC16_002288 [Serendipita sp. 398]KAG8824113.1 hypothetical protein FRC19_002523 [Serendipita sp. 401]KAG8868830.1 hypothetical protein FRC20_002730 [Serendipita sp. 405]KAG9055002.1 hypothetical protein FS842_003417 [Serendipita sp. 407]
MSANEYASENHDPHGTSRHGFDQAFHLYNAKADHEDLDFYNECNGSMDSLLVFSGLFSAVTTALIVETYKGLKPEPQSQTERLLTAILARTENSSAPSHIPESSFSPPKAIVATNILFFVSLCLSLLASLSAILMKQWSRDFYNGVRHISSARKRARTRYARIMGRKKWKLMPLLSWIPMMLHISLFIFFAGLSLWLWTLNMTMFIVIVVTAGLSLIIYLSGATVPLVDPTAPFRWPLSDAVQKLAMPLKAWRIRPTTDIEASSPETTNLVGIVPPILSTPSQASAATIIDSGTSSLDETDASLVTDLLEYSDTMLEIESSFDQLCNIITQSTTIAHRISPEIANRKPPSLQAAVETLVDGCLTY